MPELPEVETTRRGLETHLRNRRIVATIIRQPQLRWPIPPELPLHLQDQHISTLTRRGKYLLIHTPRGTLIAHLGMSGSLRICVRNSPMRKHDHLEIALDNGQALRFHDPRRFGCILWTEDNPDKHALLHALGPEPLSTYFNGDYLFQKSRHRKVAIKNFIMNAMIVVGVGNIYANEALFETGIRPSTQAGKLSRATCHALTQAIKRILRQAIKQGGTTLRDFVNGNGEPGYFSQRLKVYGRDQQPCRRCQSTIKCKVIGQRSSYYCPSCQR